MSKAPKHPFEDQRLAALAALGILDTPPEVAYDELMRLAAVLCHAPMAGITMIDRDRQWMKAAPAHAPPQIPRDASFCAHAIMGPELLEIPDTHLDERFRTSPLVTGPSNVRFYAGAPLVLSSGDAVGTLCVLDHQPRRLNETQAQAMTVLAHAVVAHLELRKLRLPQISNFLATSPAPITEPIPDAVRPVVGPIRGLSVLIVDDVVINQKVMRAVLLPHGADVHVASSGEDALELFKLRKFDVVLMDRYMPGIDGLEATRMMRELELRRGTRTPIFGISASNDSAERARFLAAGSDDTLAKPLRIDELWTKLTQWRSVHRAS